jgi:hypothetical protein
MQTSALLFRFVFTFLMRAAGSGDLFVILLSCYFVKYIVLIVKDGNFCSGFFDSN